MAGKVKFYRGAQGTSLPVAHQDGAIFIIERSGSNNLGDMYVDMDNGKRLHIIPDSELLTYNDATMSGIQSTLGQVYVFQESNKIGIAVGDGTSFIEDLPVYDITAKNSIDSLGTLATKNSVSVTAQYDKATSASYTNTNSSKTINISGTNSAVTITSTNNNNGNYQPAGTVSQPIFSGTQISGQIVSAAGSGVATYTPDGTITAPTVTLDSGMTTTIKNPTSKTVTTAVVIAAPGETAPLNPLAYCNYNATNETLSLYQLGYTTDSSISTSNVSVVKGAATYTATAPTFNGIGARLVVADFTPEGTVTQPTFTGTKVQLDGSTNISGSVTLPTISLGYTDTDVKNVNVSYS